MANRTGGYWTRPLLACVWTLVLSCKSYKCDDVSDPVVIDGQDSGTGARQGDVAPVLTDLNPRSLDILFMVDNSPWRDPKQDALAAAFPRLLEQLQNIPAGVPDLHIGVISSDMGAGVGEAGGNCSVLLGNQGILWGNDATANPDDQNNKYATIRKTKNAAGAPGCGMNVGSRWIEDIRDTTGLARTKNYQGDLADVFACLAKAVGVHGCGYEHQLQSVRVALNPSDAVNAQNIGFLRRKAYLAVVLVSDEDDCSADPSTEYNDGMFFPRTLGDAASFRCAARGHVCNGKPIPDYDPTTGYTGKGLGVDFANCDAKDELDRTKLPLIRIRDTIDSVNQVKDHPSEQIMAAGIIGWPQTMPGVKYAIGTDSTAMPTEQQKLWDYKPICVVPEIKSADGNPYKAYGGLRLKKFLDAYNKQGETNVFSLCNPDFSEAMTQIGKLLASGLGG